MASDRERCLAVGMDETVTKPTDLRELHTALRLASDKRQTVDVRADRRI